MRLLGQNWPRADRRWTGSRETGGGWPTLYVGGSRYACYLQVLAVIRPPPGPVRGARLRC